MKKAVTKKKNVPKRKKKSEINSFSDALKAFMLVGVIVAIALLISCAVIFIHSSINSQDDEEQWLTESEQQHTPLISQDFNSNDPVSQVTAPPSGSGNNSSQQISPQPNVSPPVNNNSTNTVTPPANTAAPSAQQPSTPARPSNTTTAAPAAADQRPVQNLDTGGNTSRGALVFVIDDAGNNLRELDPFLRVPYPLTIAVLPGLPYSAEAARRIRAAGKEVILHQPMEAIGAQNPGPGAIYSNMSVDEIRSVLSRNIAEVGPVTGINNHQGSKITMDAALMKVILEFCAEHGIYFLDSRTTADTAAPAAARQMGMKIAERNIFIDNEQNKSAMLRYIESGLARAQANGNVVMIGHAWSPDLAPLLSEQLPRYIEQGYSVKTVSDILR